MSDFDNKELCKIYEKCKEYIEYLEKELEKLEPNDVEE